MTLLRRLFGSPVIGVGDPTFRLSDAFPAWMIDWRMLRPMRYATGGTLLDCRLALEHGVALNHGGGYHHAASVEAMA